VTNPRDMYSRTWKVGIIGCGNIFERYVSGLARFPRLEVVGCADIDPARSAASSELTGVPAYEDPASLLRAAEVEVVVNITPPAAHGSVTRAALAAGKHVYQEKPLAASLTEADGSLAAVRSSGQALGCAPDTFLGSAGQTARAALDSGAIGDPIGVSCFVTHTLAETWHPDPTLFFRPGGGPLLDMGPYSIVNMVNCLGPVVEVSGATRIGVTPRTVTAPDRLVDSIDVEVATHASAVLRFASGVIGTVMMSFDVWGQDLPYIEIYGTTGILRLHDPNDFDGEVRIRPNSGSGWEVVEPVLPDLGRRGTNDQMLRGLGVADLVSSLGGAPQRASAELGYHVLEVLTSVEASSTAHAVVPLKSTCPRPAPVTRADWDAFFAEPGTPAASAVPANTN
jgi:predicted dehydrogenase